jgi:hypothetical protein
MRRRTRILVASSVTATISVTAVVVASAVNPDPNPPNYTFCKDTFNGQLMVPVGPDCPVSFESFEIQSGWRYRGEWNAVDVYQKGDVVGFEQGTYLASTLSSSVNPIADQTWVQLAAPPSAGPRGSQGPQGAQGDRGPQGERGPAGASGVWTWTGSQTYERSGRGANSDSIAAHTVAARSYLTGTVTAWLPRWSDGETYRCTLRRLIEQRRGNNFALLADLQIGPFQRNNGLARPALPGGGNLDYVARTTIPLTITDAGRVYLKCNMTADRPDMQVQYETAPVG